MFYAYRSIYTEIFFFNLIVARCCGLDVSPKCHGIIGVALGRSFDYAGVIVIGELVH